MAENNWISNISVSDPKYSQTYIDATYIDAMKVAPVYPYNVDHYDVQYHNSIIDSDNVNDSIKVKILYNELMTLRTELSNTERRLMGEINLLRADNKRLSDEVASIKQSLYFD